MLSILKNDFDRVLELKAYMVVSMILIICAVASAIFLTGKMQGQLNVAVVGEKDGILATQLKNSKAVKINWMEKEPKTSELVTQKYDAILLLKKDGSYHLKTVKSKEIEHKMEIMLKNPGQVVSFSSDIRKKGTNIIGFMMMFLLMQGVINARFFAEDKEKRLTERIITTPLTFGNYLAGHGLFIWLFIYIPSMLVLIGAKILGFQIGFSIPVFAVLIGILSFLSFAFALCINSFFKVSDTANMLGTSLIVLTSILAGSFGSIGQKQSILYKILHVLPQKDFINFVSALENHTVTRTSYIELIYVIIISIVFMCIGIIKTKRDYVYR